MAEYKLLYTMNEEQRLYYHELTIKHEIERQELKTQRELKSEELALKQKLFMEKLILHRVKNIKLSDGLCVPNINYTSVEVEYMNTDEFQEGEMKNLNFLELQEVVDKIYEFPHYQTFHTDECSLKKYKIIHLIYDKETLMKRVLEIGYFYTIKI